MTVRLDNRVILVTGVSAGIGRALVKVLTDRGAKVVGMARRVEAGSALTAEIKSAGGDFLFVQGDVSRPSDCAVAVNAGIQQYGRIDVLINNAARMDPVQRVEKILDPDWQAIMETTLGGVLNMSRAVLPVMQQQQDGVIIMVSSATSEQALAGAGAYTAAKAAANHLMRSIAVENLQNGVRANTVLIGVVATEMMAGGMVAMGQSVRGPEWMPDPQKSGGSVNVMLMQAEAVARSIAILCSDDAREINGATIAIDRAFSAGSFNSMAMHLAAAQLLPE